MGIVLPDAILGSPGLGYIREWMMENHRIIASIDLHVDTFQPRKVEDDQTPDVPKIFYDWKRQEGIGW